MKAIVIGRHDLSGKEGIEVIGKQRSITFPVSSDDCTSIIKGLLDEAIEKDCKIIFQAAPAQVIVAAYRVIKTNPAYEGIIGQIVSVPGERKAGVVKEFYSDDPYTASAIADAVTFANPRAKVEIDRNGQVVRITCDPPMDFVFSHIEWY